MHTHGLAIGSFRIFTDQLTKWSLGISQVTQRSIEEVFDLLLISVVVLPRKIAGFSKHVLAAFG